eukprot:TRINITY_DN22358_c0_g1_i2.p1 TRINITY_DN22358_c0_g1~~TRINITY_DN22358_c0_g1_i2.p1  ORF type:complete len:120 (-),score=23.59 TRINITY_DN22358_c0_g1_i2:652-1011(-)
MEGMVGTMTELKRRQEYIDHGDGFCSTVKRHKTQGSISMRERKEKVGEKITALQQLVSPFGKTDTASVLSEAMGYIKFLQEQVQVRRRSLKPFHDLAFQPLLSEVPCENCQIAIMEPDN